jgi:DNA primase
LIWATISAIRTGAAVAWSPQPPRINMQFPPKFLDELRARLPVSEVVGKRVKLRKAGREWKGLSPFMKESSPSFFVNDQKGFYHDFSSGKHGDIFTFVMETEGVTFAEAVERLAALAGMPVPVVSEDASSFEIGSLTDWRAWLQQQPYQVSTVYAARAALRAIPGLATALGPRGGALREFVRL